MIRDAATYLRALLPGTVGVSTQIEPAVTEPLFPCEEASVRHASPARRREFALGRACARRALRQLGAAMAPIEVGDMRAPIWPAGIVGSLTHCPAFSAAAVARSVHFQGIGIDAAVNRRLERAVRDAIVATRDEREWAERPTPLVNWDVVLFCVKESVFKAWWPWQRQWLGFEDVRVSLDVAAGSFRADLRTDHADHSQSINGRFAVSGDLILSTAVIPAPLRDDAAERRR